MLAIRAGGRGDVTRVARRCGRSRAAGRTCRRRSATASTSTSSTTAGIVAASTRRPARGLRAAAAEAGTYSASPVLADGKIYVTNEDG